MSGFLELFAGAAIAAIAIHFIGLNPVTMIAIPIVVVYLIYQRIGG